MRAPALPARRLSRPTSAAETPPVSSMLSDHTAVSSPDARRWWALAAIAVAQLMIVVDATIMNIALPSRGRIWVSPVLGVAG